MYDAPKPEAEAPPPPPCTVCRQPSATAFWEGFLCAACFGAWTAAPHDTEAAELAHAAAHPGDVEASGVAPSGRRWVSLKQAAHVELHRNVARAWVRERRGLKPVAGGAA